jgi:hypothetical protein
MQLGLPRFPLSLPKAWASPSPRLHQARLYGKGERFAGIDKTFIYDIHKTAWRAPIDNLLEEMSHERV